MTHVKKLALTLVAASLFSAAPALAVSSYGSGGGGGGGGSYGGPSGGFSAPAYSPVADYQAGVKYLQDKDYAQAERRFSKVIRGTRRNANANYFMGLAKVGQDEHKGSIRYFKSAVKYDKKLYKAHGSLGAAYAVTGKADKANKVMATLNEAAVSCGTCSDAGQIKAAQNQITAALSGDTAT